MGEAPKRVEVYDESLAPVGIVNRDYAARHGLLHRTFHCWIFRGGPDPAILFQERGAEKTLYPNLLDISVAGHFEPGEEVENGVREIQEELGIKVRSENLKYLGRRFEVQKFRDFNINAFNEVFLLENSDEDELEPQKPEVTAIYWMRVRDAISFFSEESIKVEVVEDHTRGPNHSVRRVCGSSDFVPRHDRYYLKIAKLVDAHLTGDNLLVL